MKFNIWQKKHDTNFHLTEDVRVVLPQDALTVIFDECDRFDHDETGGRIIGTFKKHGNKLTLHVTGIIDAGPRAERSAVSFFQDGEHQEPIFRQIERDHPDIEHLGNWHTHHMNGLSTLSTGDLATYHRIVNHKNQNTPFFYALLVVAKNRTTNPLQRYSIKHYIFHRDDWRAYEIPHQYVEIVHKPLVWPLEPAHDAKHKHGSHSAVDNVKILPERVYDRDILGEFYQKIRPFTSPKLGIYWRGPIELSDGSEVQIVIVEDSSSHAPQYSILLREPPDTLKAIAEKLAKWEFSSARAALITTERNCNRILYEQRSESKW